MSKQGTWAGVVPKTADCTCSTPQYMAMPNKHQLITTCMLVITKQYRPVTRFGAPRTVRFCTTMSIALSSFQSLGSCSPIYLAIFQAFVSNRAHVMKSNISVSTRMWSVNASTVSGATPALGGAPHHRHATALVISPVAMPLHSCFKSNVIPSHLKAGHFLAGSQLHASVLHSGRPDRGALTCRAAAEKETVAVTG